MSRLMTAVWVAQTGVLAVMALLCIGWPHHTLRLFEANPACIDEQNTRHVLVVLYACVRLMVPYFVAFSFFSLQAAMRTEEQVRRSLATVFAWIQGALLVLLTRKAFQFSAQELEVLPLQVMIATLIILGSLSFYESLKATDRPQRYISALASGTYLALAIIAPQGIRFELLAACSLGLFILGDVLRNVEMARIRRLLTVLLLPGLLTLLSLVGDQSLALWKSNPPAVFLLFLMLGIGVVLNAAYALWPSERPLRRMSGSANTKPPELWVLWFVQGVCFLTLASFMFSVGGQHWPLFFRTPWEARCEPLVMGAWSPFPIFVAAMGLFSFAGLPADRQWAWKAFCNVFIIFHALVVVAVVFSWDDTSFTALSAMLALPSVILLVRHVMFLRVQREWLSEEVGEGPAGWIPRDLVAGPLLLLRTLRHGQRASHAQGVAAWGRLQVLPGDYPPHEFFQPGRVYQAVARFSNERSDDDASADARGVALRMVAPGQPPFDLLMATGAYISAQNILEYGLVALGTALGPLGWRWLALKRRFLEGGLAALRRAPESYARLWYHSQAVRFWVARDNRRYLVRYRLVPQDISLPESGLPVTRGDFLNRDRPKAERRPTDYLRRELRLRLQGSSTVVLHLQAQFHLIKPGDNLTWYNPATDWHTGEHPWKDIAVLTLEDALAEAAAERLCFNPDNAPSSLGTPVAHSPLDYRSIADSERRVMRRIQQTRLWMIETFGPPKSPPRPTD